MKRTKLVLGVAALSAALLGTGYAAMTDVLTIGGTVNTASFDVDFVEDIAPVGDVATNPDNYEITNMEVNNSTKEADRVSFAISNLKPGVAVQHETTMGNVGSIDAQLKSIKLEGMEGVSENLKKHVKVTVKLGEGDTYNWTLADENMEKNIKDVILQETGDKDGLDKVKAVITVEIDGEAFGGEATSENINFDLKFNWEQTGLNQ